MDDSRTFAISTAAIGIVAIAHTAFTWPVAATIAFFGGGALVAFAAEVVVVHRGCLTHHVWPNVAASRSTCSSGGPE